MVASRKAWYSLIVLRQERGSEGGEACQGSQDSARIWKTAIDKTGGVNGDREKPITYRNTCIERLLQLD